MPESSYVSTVQCGELLTPVVAPVQYPPTLIKSWLERRDTLCFFASSQPGARLRTLHPVRTYLNRPVLPRRSKGVAHRPAAELVPGLDDGEVVSALLVRGPPCGHPRDTPADYEDLGVSPPLG